jgi:hypothetical protein
MEFTEPEHVPAGSGPLRKKLQRRITDRRIGRPNSEPPADRLRQMEQLPKCSTPAARISGHRSYLIHMRKTAFVPCLPTRGTKVPAGKDWLHEIKHDG